MRVRQIITLFAISIVLLLVLGMGTNSTSASLVPVEAWNRTFGGARHDGAYDLKQTTDGGYILAGFTRSYGASVSTI